MALTFDPAKCIFPPASANPRQPDPRQLAVGDRVCVRWGVQPFVRAGVITAVAPDRRSYTTRPVPRLPGAGNADVRGWPEIGVFPKPPSSTAVEKVLSVSGVPADVEERVRGFAGMASNPAYQVPNPKTKKGGRRKRTMRRKPRRRTRKLTSR